MRRELIHIYGPISIYSYGVAIAIGVLIFAWLLQQHPRYKKLGLQDKFADIMIAGILLATFGGRFLYWITESENPLSLSTFFSFWEGGFSVLGSIVGIIVIMPFILKAWALPIVQLLDLAAIYTPLLQGISRFGCLFAGCCYGAPSGLPWSITYTHENTVAPLYIAMHPTQIYSAGLLFIIFLFLYFCLQSHLKKPGQLLMAYLMLTSFERFFVDFWRAVRVFATDSFLPHYVTSMLSTYQLLALIIFITAASLFIYISLKSQECYE